MVFNLKPSAAACRSALCPWTETVLHNFPEYHGDGSLPGSGDVVFDQAGNLYGTTITGGSADVGAVYELTPSGTESVLWSFTGGQQDGSYPWSGVIFDGSGNLYGTTTEGGDPACVGGCGTVYKMTPSGSGWTEKPIYSFTGGSDGAVPYGGLIFDQSGNLYGTTISGGINGESGTVFELTPNPDGSWNFNLLYSFNGNGGPDGSLTMDAAGNLYGITAENDCPDCSTYGDVFELTPSGRLDLHQPARLPRWQRRRGAAVRQCGTGRQRQCLRHSLWVGRVRLWHRLEDHAVTEILQVTGRPLSRPAPLQRQR